MSSGGQFCLSADTDFMTDNYEALKERGYSDHDIEQLHVGELIACLQEWVDKNLK